MHKIRIDDLRIIVYFCCCNLCIDVGCKCKPYILIIYYNCCNLCIDVGCKMASLPACPSDVRCNLCIDVGCKFAWLETVQVSGIAIYVIGVG